MPTGLRGPLARGEATTPDATLEVVYYRLRALLDDVHRQRAEKVRGETRRAEPDTPADSEVETELGKRAR